MDDSLPLHSTENSLIRNRRVLLAKVKLSAALLHDFLDRRSVGAVGQPVGHRLTIAGQRHALSGLERLLIRPALRR